MTFRCYLFVPPVHFIGWWSTYRWRHCHLELTSITCGDSVLHYDLINRFKREDAHKIRLYIRTYRLSFRNKTYLTCTQWSPVYSGQFWISPLANHYKQVKWYNRIKTWFCYLPFSALRCHVFILYYVPCRIVYVLLAILSWCPTTWCYQLNS